MSTSTFFKNFTNWFELKPELDNLPQRPLFQEREVWNCHLGVNVGFELDGKNDKFIKPILVLKKLTHNTFLGIPLTSKLINGSWYVKSTVQKKEDRYIISQIKMIDFKRLYNKVERIPDEEFHTMKSRFINFMQN